MVVSFQDVASDGNRGYRALAVALGFREEDWRIIRHALSLHVQRRRELLEDLYGVQSYEAILRATQWFNGDATEEYWFTTITAVVAADLFRRPVVILGEELRNSATYLPYTADAFNSTPVTLKNVSNAHWGACVLRPQFLPRIDFQWQQIMERRRPDLRPLYQDLDDAVQAWKDLYMQI